MIQFRMSRILDFTAPKDETLTYPTPQWPPPPPPPSSLQITPAILLTIIILSAIFFLSGLIHLLIRFFTKRPSSSQSYLSSSTSSGTSHPLQRQLHELFQLHDSGLDQTAIDALPIFYYNNIIGLKEPSDCAVCLCEFSDQDKLRLLPNCSHAFHVQCIDTWLLSSSSCPLCRGSIIGEEESDLELGFGVDQKRVVNRVFSVRLGKFRRFDDEGEVRSEEEGSGRCLDSRRCYSMGSYQYIVGDLDLQVALSCRARQEQRRVVSAEEEGSKRIGRWSRSGDSFSISKIWLWPKNSSSSGRFSSRFSSSLGSMQLPIDNVTTMQNNNEALD